MNWRPITEPPTKNGDYYVRRPMCATHDMRSTVRHWDIDTYGYTTDGGWNTTVDFDGETRTEHVIKPGPGWQWAYVETMTEAQYRKLNGWEV